MFWNIGWIFYFVSSLLICNSSDERTRLWGRKISIANCHSDLARRFGDTLWLSGCRVGDSLDISFDVLPSVGYGWYIVEEQDVQSLEQRITDSVTKEGENPLRTYLFEFAIKRQKPFLLHFVYRRGVRGATKASCIIAQTEESQ
jgi:hypothetical protein